MLNKKSLIIHGVFVAIQIIITCIFLFAEMSSRTFSALNFSVVAIAFVHAIIVSGKSPHKIIFLTAMLFTVISDVFLTLRYTKTGSYTDQVVAMCTFSVTQICYAIYLFLQSNNKKVKIANVIVRAILSIAVIVATVVVLKDDVNALAVIAMFYFTNLIINALFAFIEFKNNPLFAVGLLFFIFCDILIGLGIAMEMFITVSQTSFIYKMVYGFNHGWMFYSISQTLISLSISQNLAFLRKCENKKADNKKVSHR